LPLQPPLVATYQLSQKYTKIASALATQYFNIRYSLFDIGYSLLFLTGSVEPFRVLIRGGGLISKLRPLGDPPCAVALFPFFLFVVSIVKSRTSNIDERIKNQI
jgi:hypothetical protein